METLCCRNEQNVHPTLMKKFCHRGKRTEEVEITTEGKKIPFGNTESQARDRLRAEEVHTTQNLFQLRRLKTLGRTWRGLHWNASKELLLACGKFNFLRSERMCQLLHR